MSNIGEYLRNSREDEQLIIYQEPNKKENKEEETNEKCISLYSPWEVNVWKSEERGTESHVWVYVRVIL